MNIKAPVPSDIPALRVLWKEAFGDSDEFLDSFFSTAFSTDRCRFIASNEKPLAVLYWFDCLYMNKPVAYLYAIATAKSHRGQGLCHHLMHEVHSELQALGYAGAVLVPADSRLFELYQTLGYQTCCYIHELSCSASQNRAALRCIDVDEYGALRRKLLPSEGIVQENENLDFLATQGTLYAGDNFLLAARLEHQQLIGIELLGDTSIAPNILCALGCSQGTFRTHGHRMPFAMYHDFSNGTLPQPSYFGLAFD